MQTTVYSKPNCAQCLGTYRDLDKRGVSYDVIDATKDTEAFALLESLNSLQMPTVILRDEEGSIVEHWSGNRPEKISEYFSN